MLCYNNYTLTKWKTTHIIGNTREIALGSDLSNNIAQSPQNLSKPLLSNVNI